MDAIVTAGGRPKPEEPLYAYTQGSYKAMLDIAGKPMIQWVLDALSGSEEIDSVVVIGLPPDCNLTCLKPISYIDDQGGMIENVRAGVTRVLENHPEAEYVLTVSSDIPGITSEMVDWVVRTAMETRHDAYYNVITRQVMESRYPGSRRSYIRVKDMEVCGGDMNVLRTSMLDRKEAIWQKIVDARKNALKQAYLIGFDTLLLLVLRLATLDQLAARISKRLQLKGRAIVCPYAEIGMDVDKPHQLEIMRADIASRAVPA